MMAAGGYKMFVRLGESNGGVVGANAMAGFGAETLALMFYTPLDVAKQRLQVSPVGTTVATMARGLLRERGVAGLWAGYWAGLAVWGPYSAIYFGVYESIKKASQQQYGVHDNHGNNAHQRDGSSSSNNSDGGSLGDGRSAGGAFLSPVEFAAGVTGGAVGAVVTQPLDCAKTRLQVGAQEVSSVLGRSDARHVIPAGLGLVRTLRAIVKEEGAAVLWRGAAARALHLAPGAGITISVFEAIYRLLDPGTPSPTASDVT
jgi:hypothetical protein